MCKQNQHKKIEREQNSTAVYTHSIILTKNLSEQTIQAMASLYQEYFDGSSEVIFRQDLADKDEVILLYHQKQLVGFTALKVFDFDWQGKLNRIVYSGDTIVAFNHWGQQRLAFAWIAHVGQIRRRNPTLPLYWFLLVKGHRTFKYLAVFAKSFFPHWDYQRDDLKDLADQLALIRFGYNYDPASGLVRFPESRGHLKPEIADASPRELNKIATQFFFQKNPHYHLGHELVCLCELELANMKALVARVFYQTRNSTSI